VTSAKVGAFVMTALVIMYLVLVGERSLALIFSEDSIGVAIGWLMLFLPVVAFWAIAMELRFGLKIEKLGNKLHEQDAWPRFNFETRPSGRPTKESAEAVFDTYRRQVESDEQNWQKWFALGLAYDAAGDRSRARKAMREAIKLFT
jgi:cytochrome c-type biogenesis protein CcmH/NrfG